MKKPYSLVVCGATFDHLHKGHEAFLRFLLRSCERVLIGLTSDRFAHSKEFPDTIEPYKTRSMALVAFLKKLGARERVSVLPIDSLFIPKQWENLPIEVIVATKETQKGARLANKRLRDRGYPQLPIVLCPLVLAEDGKPISSFRIRKGEINRKGELCIKEVWFEKTLLLADKLRAKLKKPLGLLVRNFDAFAPTLDPSRLATVGDVVTLSANTLSLKHHISIVDFHVGRKKRFSNLSELGFLGSETVRKANNPAGQLTSSLFTTATAIFQRADFLKRIVVVVRGEEDLSVLPLALSAPLGFTILYGQPGEGVVVVPVTEESKEYIGRIVRGFHTRGY